MTVAANKKSYFLTDQPLCFNSRNEELIRSIKAISPEGFRMAISGEDAQKEQQESRIPPTISDRKGSLSSHRSLPSSSPPSPKRVKYEQYTWLEDNLIIPLYQLALLIPPALFLPEFLINSFSLESSMSHFLAILSSIICLLVSFVLILFPLLKKKAVRLEVIQSVRQEIQKLEITPTPSPYQHNERLSSEEAQPIEDKLIELLVNPIAAIHTAIDFIRKNPDSPDIEKLLDVIEKETKVSRKILTQVIKYNHPDPIDKQKTDLTELIYPVATQSLLQKGFQFECDVKPKQFILNVDRDQMREVFRQLFENAAEAFQSTGVPPGECKVRLRSVLENGWVIIKVCDNGPGLPENFSLQKVDPKLADSNKQSGFGLPICSWILEQHEGKFACSTCPKESECNGACFQIKLKVA